MSEGNEGAVAAVEGSAKTSVRLLGLAMVALGVVVHVVNYGIMHMTDRYYPALVVIGTVMIPVGAFEAITGIAAPRRWRGLPPSEWLPGPLWWKIGYIACLVAGVGVGFYACSIIEGW